MFKETVRCYNDCYDFRIHMRIENVCGVDDVVEIEPSGYVDLSYENVCDYGATLIFYKGNIEWQALSTLSFLGYSEIRFYQLNQMVMWEQIDGTYLDRIRYVVIYNHL